MAYSRRAAAFDTATLNLLEQVFESTWAIIESRYPFRDSEKDQYFKSELGRKLFILATNGDLSDLDGLQRAALESMPSGW